jgi:hypothetical protein
LKDDGPDLAVTMARLDRRLRQAIGPLTRSGFFSHMREKTAETS